MKKIPTPNSTLSIFCIRLLKILVFAYVITAVLLLILAELVYKAELNEQIVNISIILIYIIATFAGGHIAGKSMKTNKYIWGMIVGLCYFIILLIISAIINGSITNLSSNILTALLLCVGSSTLGGMLA